MKKKIKMYFSVIGFMLLQGWLIFKKPSLFNIFILPVSFSICFWLNEIAYCIQEQFYKNQETSK